MNANRKIHAYPVKDYFIHTIIEDIDLQNCVLDLLDNCIDGAKRVIAGRTTPEQPNGLHHFQATMTCSPDSFEIRDNCGGIPLDYAIDYAFHFGKRSDTPEDAKGLIGLYGIGMKRAIFKMGTIIDIVTSTDDIAYKVPINVPEWQKKRDWDFDFEDAEKFDVPGTSISIKGLKKDISEEFSLDSFQNRLRRIIARDYSFFLQKGFQVTVNNIEVKPYDFRLREGADFKPINTEYQDEIEKDVRITIYAGMADIPPEEDTPEELDKIKEVDYYGWFVACNDRIVLPGDKTSLTVWGRDDNFPRWHSQYYGFMGIINFSSSDPRKLPWDSTKRRLNPESGLYKRAVTKMKEFTRQYIDYTNERKDDLDRAKKIEQAAESKSLFSLSKSDKIIAPPFIKKPKVRMVNIQYRKPEDLVKKVADSLGYRNMPYKEVGIETFDYYVDVEIVE